MVSRVASRRLNTYLGLHLSSLQDFSRRHSLHFIIVSILGFQVTLQKALTGSNTGRGYSLEVATSNTQYLRC